MENREKLSLNQLQAKDGRLEVHHTSQEFESPTLREEKPVEIAGTIQAPGNFIEVRDKAGVDGVNQEDHARTHALYNYREGFIKLHTRENFQNDGYTIKGQLTRNPKIADLKINVTSPYRNANELAQKLKFNKVYFQDAASCEKIVQNLMRFTLNAEKEIKAWNDERGGVTESFVMKNESNVDLFFNLAFPVFIGQPKKPFRVDIRYDVREKGIDLYLESTELEELLVNDAQLIIDAELKRLPDTIVRVEQ